MPSSGKSSVTTTSASALNSYEDLKTRKAWDFAISPLKSLPMQAFMLYMSGGGVQIFSMGIVAMLLLSPFKNLSSMNIGAFACVLPHTLYNNPLVLSFVRYSLYVLMRHRRRRMIT